MHATARRMKLASRDACGHAYNLSSTHLLTVCHGTLPAATDNLVFHPVARLGGVLARVRGMAISGTCMHGASGPSGPAAPLLPTDLRIDCRDPRAGGPESPCS